MNDILETVMRYYNFGSSQVYHRFQSWEKCYSHFQRKYQNNETEISELDTLQLGFYLSSWGMYRPSGFLLKKSSEIHKPVLAELFNKPAYELWQNRADMLTDTDIFIDQLFKLKAEIIGAYQSVTIDEQNVTDTLITKILLGTMGIRPAYDRLFKNGCRIKNVRPYTNFSKQSCKAIIQFYDENQDAFHCVRDKINQSNETDYPPMKLLDMYFWTLGSNLNFDLID